MYYFSAKYKKLEKLVSNALRIIVFIGKQSAWLNLFLVLIICFDVLQRYLFNQSYNWILETEWHLFGLIFLLGSAYTLQEDKHVRVDIFYATFSEKRKAWVDLLGSLILLIPWSVICIKTCLSYANNSWFIREGSPNPGGLPAWYPIKYFVVLCFVMLLVQGILLIIKNIKTILR